MPAVCYVHPDMVRELGLEAVAPQVTPFTEWQDPLWALMMRFPWIGQATSPAAAGRQVTVSLKEPPEFTKALAFGLHPSISFLSGD